MRDAHDPAQNFINALYERDKGRYLPVFDEYGEEQEPVLVQIDNCIHCGMRLEVEHGE